MSALSGLSAPAAAEAPTGPARAPASEVGTLAAAVAQAQGQGAWARTVPAVAALTGASAVAVGLGAPWVCAALPLAGLALRAHLPAATVAAARLDAAAQLEGALVCAWDHRQRGEPVVAAQRRRALVALATRPEARAWPRPHRAWAAAALLWIWPLLQPPGAGGADPAAGSEAVAAAGVAGDVRPGADTEAAAAPATEPEGARTQGPPPAPDAGPPDRGPGRDDAGGGSAASPSTGGGVGTEAGDRPGAPGGRVASGTAGAGMAAELAVPRVAGAHHALGGPRLAGAPPVGVHPDDGAVLDPARPYPPQYRPVVQRWFALQSAARGAEGLRPAGTAHDAAKGNDRP